METTRRLRTCDILVDAGAQVRAAPNDAVANDYAEQLAGGATFPPIVVFDDGAELHLADGYHRLTAHELAGRTEIEAQVRTGTKADALWFALGANRAHGLRLTNTDKRHAVALALTTWPEKTQVEIARQVGCSQGLVSQCISRNRLPRPDRVIRRNNRPYPARRPVARQQDEPSDAATAGKPGYEARLGRIREMGSAGCSVAQIAGALGVTVDTVERVADKHAVPIKARRAVPSRGQRIDSDRLVSALARQVGSVTAEWNLIDFAALDRAQLPEWIAELARGRRETGRLIRRLREEEASTR